MPTDQTALPSDETTLPTDDTTLPTEETTSPNGETILTALPTEETNMSTDMTAWSTDIPPDGTTTEAATGHFLLVVGGQSATNVSDVDISSGVELISLDQSANPVPECLSSLNDLPFTVGLTAAGAVLTQGRENRLYYKGVVDPPLVSAPAPEPD